MSKKSIRFFNDCVVRAVWDDGLILRDGVPYIWQFDGGYVELDTNGTPTSWNYSIKPAFYAKFQTLIDI